MKKVAIIIGLLLLFLILCQTLVMSAGLINEPSTLLFNTGLVLFGLQIFAIVALAKGNYEAALYDAKTKEILSQPKLLQLYKAETERIWAEKGKSPYGQNNVFGSTSGILLNR